MGSAVITRERVLPDTQPSLEDYLAAGSRKGSLLLVEDVPDFRELFQFVLEREGYRVHVAENGVECLRRAKTLRPDLIILNYLMPVMDGLTALQKLKQDCLTSYLKVVMYSACGEKLRPLALEAGAVDYLSSPFEVKTLVLAVERALRR